MGLIVLLAIVLLVGSFGIIPQFKTYVVQSGSMEPALKTGSIAMVAKSSSYWSQDIISFTKGTGKDNVVTHRVIDRIYSEEIINKYVYSTKGDANSSIDQDTVSEEQIVGKVVFSIPYLGYFTEFVKQPYGFILFVVIPATIIVYEELKSLKKEFLALLSKIRHKREEDTYRTGGNSARIYFIVIPLIAAAIAVSSLSLSYFSDTEQSRVNAFVAGVWITPTLTPPPTLTPTPTPSQLADHIVISEVQLKGANANQDFVELYNPTNSGIDINGWRLQIKTSNGTESTLADIPSGKTIPAHGFFLWASDKDAGYASSVGADITNNNTISENKSIALLNSSSSTPIDQVAWGNGTNQFVEGTQYPNSPATNESIERKAYATSDTSSMVSGSDADNGNAYDSENNSNDFIVRTQSDPQNTGSAPETP